MTQKEIKEKIAALRDAMEGETDKELLDRYQAKIEKLEAQLEADKPKPSPKKDKAPTKSKAMEEDEDDEPFSTAPLRKNVTISEEDYQKCMDTLDGFRKEKADRERADLERRAMAKAETKAEKQEIKDLPTKELRVMLGEAEPETPTRVSKDRTQSLLEKLLSLFKAKGHKYEVPAGKSEEVEKKKAVLVSKSKQRIAEVVQKEAEDIAIQLKEYVNKLK